MLTADIYEGLRPATIDDVGVKNAGAIQPLEEDGTLVRRSRERLEMEIWRSTCWSATAPLAGCAALYPFPAERLGELACGAVQPAYRSRGRADALPYVSNARPAPKGLNGASDILTTRAAHCSASVALNLPRSPICRCKNRRCTTGGGVPKSS